MLRADFKSRHLGPNDDDIKKILSVIGVKSIEDLIKQAVPDNIRTKNPPTQPAMSEDDYLKWISKVASQNKIFKSFIGQGFYNCLLPNVIARNILENPSWYTQYTPYQPEISQGRLELLMVFQTMITEMTSMEIANASLLDEASAAAEAMQMAFRITYKQNLNQKEPKNKFFVDENCFNSTFDVLKTRADLLDIDLVVGDVDSFNPDNKFFAGLLQTPNSLGKLYFKKDFYQKLSKVNALSIVGCDLLSLAIFKPPGEFGADIVYGNSQRFGVPLNYGGPHAAFLAAKSKFIREMPGRIVGLSVDASGKKAYRLCLQIREQHIKREKATSNICTAQTLLAIIASAYCVYHGPEGLINIAQTIKKKASFLKDKLIDSNYKLNKGEFFDTLSISLSSKKEADEIMSKALNKKINFFRAGDDVVNISLDETSTNEDIEDILDIFNCKAITKDLKNWQDAAPQIKYGRDDKFLTQAVFHNYRSETEMLRFLKNLENKDLSLANAMIPLGSCTMKLNPTSAMVPISWQKINSIHPFAPLDQAAGYQTIFKELKKYLTQMTGFKGVSLHPNSGAQGEFAGLLVIKSYLKFKRQTQRNVVLIPTSAHGTNPASARMCGMEVATVECDQQGNIDIENLKAQIKLHQNKVACLMITYPSTHGIFEENIIDIIDLVHLAGGQVYMDGANMNAQIGLTSPAKIKADVCHLNLHKTFAIPHGGGGPGAGPILVAEHLVPFLPKHRFNNNNKTGENCVCATPWGSAAILVISLGYLKMLGHKGCYEASKIAILNANYILKKLEGKIPTLYTNKKNRVAHELILDVRILKSKGIEVMDVAKRLIDYSFHPPTVSFPVPGTIMIEPTESESKYELDRFCEALINIKQEWEDIDDKNPQSKKQNVLKNAPHNVDDLISEKWAYSYSKTKAFFPVEASKDRKFWPSVKRVNEVFGDRNLKCTLSE